MRSENRKERKAEIEACAYDVLAEQGYAGASMLAIAKRAKASNETMYRWYGDKRGLFAALLRENASDVATALIDQDRVGEPVGHVLKDVGTRLLTLLVSEKAILLNRAAAADATGELGVVIGQCGRETVMPLILKLMKRAMVEGWLKTTDASEVTETFLSLLVGDWQIRRVIGTLSEVTPKDIEKRANQAYDQFCQLYGAQV